MSLTAEQTTAQNFKDFYDRIRPLLNAQHYHVDRSGQELKSGQYALAESVAIGTGTNITVAVGAAIPFVKQSGDFVDGPTTGSFIVPAGMRIEVTLFGTVTDGSNNNSGVYLYNETDGVYLDSANSKQMPGAYFYGGQASLYGMSQSCVVQWTNNTGKDIAVSMRNAANGTVLSLRVHATGMTVKEIGRIVDPIQYMSSGDNLEETPVGNIISYMGNNVPKHYLACNGTTYSIGSYPELEAHFIAEFGSVNYFGGDGTSTFAVPDLRGEFLRGTGTNSHANQGAGENVGIHQDGTATPSISAGYDGLYINNIPASGTNGSDNIDSGYKKNASNRSASVNIAGTWSTTANNMTTSRPTNTSVQYCIKYETTYHVIVPSHAYKVSVAASVTASSQAQITFDSSDIIGDSSLVSGNTFIAPMSGWYSVGMNWSQGGSGEVGYYTKINGDNAGYNRGIILSNTYYMNKGDSLTLYKESGSANSGRVNFCLLTSNYNENIIAGGEVYSTTEQVIGTHIDGKPLYQITYKKDNVTNGATTVESSFITNKSVDRVINIEACRLGTNGYIDSFDADNNYVCINNGNIVINMAQTGVTWSWLITIKYTKTTDVANTYTYKNSLLLTRPDLWTPNTEIDFGGGLYGYRATGNMPNITTTNVWTSFFEYQTTTTAKIVSCGGNVENKNSSNVTVSTAFMSSRNGYLDSNLIVSSGGVISGNVIVLQSGPTYATACKYDIWFTFKKS